MSKLLGAILCVLLVGGFPVNSQAGDEDRHFSPLVRNFSARDYRAGTQNWCLTRHSNGLLYVGNTAGVLEYDGKNWQIIRTKDDAGVRSLFSDPQSGRIYVGATSEFGYLEPNAQGQMIYFSLKEKLPPQEQSFAEVWNTFVAPDGVYFYTDFALFRWDGKKMHILHPENKEEGFYSCVYTNNNIYIHIQDKGLHILKNGKIELLPDGDHFKGDGIFNIEQYDDQRIIFRTINKGIFIYDGIKVKPFESPIANTLKNAKPYQIRRLKNGDFAFVTFLDGVFITDPLGNLKMHLNEKSGLKDNQAVAAFDDTEGNLWIALMSGLAVVQYPNPLIHIPAKVGFNAGIIALKSANEKVYAGTLEGLFEMNTDGLKPSIRKIEGIKGIVYDINVQEGRIWASTQYGIIAYADGKTQNISPLSATAIVRSKKHANLCYVGTWTGMTALRRQPDGSWKEESPLKQLKAEVCEMQETPDGKLWVWLRRGGVAKIDFSGGYSTDPQITFYTEKDGLPDRINNPVKNINGQIVFCTKKGFYQYDEQKKRFIPNENLNACLPDTGWGLYEALVTKEGDIWVHRIRNHYERETGVLQKTADGKYLYSKAPFASLGNDVAINGITVDHNGITWIATMDAVIGYNPVINKTQTHNFKPLLRKIQNAQAVNVFNGVASSNNKADKQEPIVFNYQDAHNITFTIGSTLFSQSDHTLFQYRIDPFDSKWSAPVNDPVINYTGLLEGSYTLRVRAINAYGQFSEELRYPIRILPPWYRHWLAYLGYILSAGLIVWGIVQWRVKELKKARILLEQRVNERTQEIDFQKQALEASNKEIMLQKQELEHQNQLMDSYSRQINQKKTDLEKALEIISQKNLEADNIHHEITLKNQLLNEKNAELEKALTEVAQANEETRALNDQLTHLNSELIRQKADLVNAFEEIHAKNDQLESANLEIQRQYKLLGDQNEELFAGQEELKRTLEHLQEAQAQLIMSEKMGVLGTMMAGVAHEINTPIGAIKAAAENVHANLPILIPKLPDFFAKLNPKDLEMFFQLVDVAMKAEPIGSVAEERQIRKNVALALEAMGIPKADTLARTLSKIGVYKQLNDFVVLFKHPSSEEIVEMAGTLGKMRLNADNILTAVGKTQKIIFALRSFSHQNPSVEMLPCRIESQIPLALTLYHNTLKQGVEVSTEFEEGLPEIYCYPDELDQVWINLITNAVHAMNNKGELRIKVYSDDSYIRVSITDSGPGIPTEIQPYIFDAFFTTKAQGEGTGLGLHICKQIIDKHQGLIALDSVPGKTTFTVALPLRLTSSQGIRAPQA